MKRTLNTLTTKLAVGLFVLGISGCGITEPEDITYEEYYKAAINYFRSNSHLDGNEASKILGTAMPGGPAGSPLDAYISNPFHTTNVVEYKKVICIIYTNSSSYMAAIQFNVIDNDGNLHTLHRWKKEGI